MPPADTAQLKVFISYSRRDCLEFSKQLALALEAFGHHPIIDLQGISGGEEWQPRLGQMILESDTVVFVLSPESAVSPVCAWEVEEASRLGKRFIPIIAMPLEGTEPPERLRKLNYIHFYAEPDVPDSGFGQGLAKLNTALTTDMEWLREHTRLTALAERWQSPLRGGADDGGGEVALGLAGFN